MVAAIEMNKVKKSYGKNIVAIDHLSLTVEEGTIYALLGPNGCGKTTTIRTLTSLAPIDEGEIHIFGKKGVDKSKIGVVAQNSGVDLLGTGKENLMLQGRIYGLKGEVLKKRVGELLKIFGLEKEQNRLSRHYSGGMKRKLDLAMGIIHQPKLLFLDEPTTGLDPKARADLWKTIRRLQLEEGMTVVLTTHYMEEADELSDRVAFMNEGKLIVEGTAKQLKSKIGMDTITLRCKELEQAFPILEQSYSVLCEQENLHVQVEQGSEQLPAILKILEKNQIDVLSISVSKPDLGDVYLFYTGKKLREEEKQ